MFTKDTILSYLDKKLIRVQKHPDANLFIYNYTATTQYDCAWDQVTLNCRGLILDENCNIIARPFPKFFNIGELKNEVIPNEPFDVFEKMDGSLGILYWLNDKAYIATRGSFESEQSIMATEMLNTIYRSAIPSLDRTKTYLFEIIYPQNRIVVDYKEMKALVLLGIVDTKTGKEAPLVNTDFPVVKSYSGINDIAELKSWKEDNKEGFVIRFKNGLRLKIKLEEYVRLHRIITNISTVDIWKHLQNEENLKILLERVPDEFYKWVKAQELRLISGFRSIEIQCRADFKVFNTRKETAAYFATCAYPSILFNMLDKRDYSKTIWRHLRPKYCKPFYKKITFEGN